MDKSLNVLIVEGSKPEAESLLARLSAAGIACHVRHAGADRTFAAAISESCPDLILAGFSLPAVGGQTAFALAQRLCPEVPFLFLAEDLGQKAHMLDIIGSDLEQFAYAASHDLQEPLRTISLFSKLLSTRYKGALDEQADDYLKFIESAAQQMGALLEDLSIYTQLPVQPKDFEQVDLNGVLRHTLSFLLPVIEERHAAITCGHLPEVLGTASLLGLVFQNLIGNALKYHSSNPPLIHVDAAFDESAREDTWVISVKDNGIGFPQQYAGQVFGLFKRLNKRDFPGTGLGLAICKRVVEVHGGRIWADSQIDVGSTFYFTIPTKEQWQKSSSAVA